MSGNKSKDFIRDQIDLMTLNVRLLNTISSKTDKGQRTKDKVN